MLSWNSPAEVPQDFADTAVTIGKFDGVHLGHQALLARVVDLAEENLFAAVVLTFDRHPDALLNPDQCKLPLIGPAQKNILLAENGIDATLTLTFDEALAEMSPAEFVENILVKTLKAKIVVVGEGFRFGHQGAGNVEVLRELGWQVLAGTDNLKTRAVGRFLLRMDEQGTLPGASLIGLPTKLRQASTALVSKGLRLPKVTIKK